MVIPSRAEGEGPHTGATITPFYIRVIHVVTVRSLSRGCEIGMTAPLFRHVIEVLAMLMVAVTV